MTEPKMRWEPDAIRRDGAGDAGAAAEAPSTPDSAGPGVSGKRARRGPGSYDRTLTPDERRDEQRETLIRAAAYVFAKHGYANASVAAILEASGLSRGTFYRHYKDLQEIFVAVQENAGQVLLEKLARAVQSTDEPLARLQRAIEAYLVHCAENGDLSRVFHQEALISGEEYAALRRRCIEGIQAFFQDGLEKAVERKLIARMPDDLTIYAIIIAIEGVARRYLAERREPALREAYEPLLRLALRAFT